MAWSVAVLMIEYRMSGWVGAGPGSPEVACIDLRNGSSLESIWAAYSLRDRTASHWESKQKW